MTVHHSPLGAAALTPCCARSPLDLVRHDQLTNDIALVTCVDRPCPWCHRTVAADDPDLTRQADPTASYFARAWHGPCWDAHY